jgi:hypothetical protein
MFYATLRTFVGKYRNTATGKKVSSCGYEVNTLNPHASWIRLYYTIKRSEENIDFKISLQTTHPYYGGARWWFTCPLSTNGRPCYRRVGKLYLPPGGKYYGCRHCYDLTYTSCQESHQFDALFARIAEDTGTTPEMVKRILSRKIGL